MASWLFLAVSVLAQPLQPSAIITDPVPRLGTSSELVDVAPCGNTKPGSSHLLAEPGSLNPVSWMVTTPALSGNCTIRLSQTNDFKHPVTLFPLDDSANELGKFACGRNADYEETKTVRFPDNMSCSPCSLQWIWETYSGTFFQCVDLTLLKAGDERCLGKCQHEGVCIDGVCQCLSAHFGDFCEHTYGQSDSISVIGYFVMFVSFCIVFSLLSAGTYFYFSPQHIPPKIHSWLEANAPWCIRHEHLINISEEHEIYQVEGGEEHRVVSRATQ